MINELYQLTAALSKADIVTEYTHPKYKPIPKVTKKAPCVHIILDKGEIYKVRNIEQEQAAEIKKYGSNQGTFPAMNLAPLYRLTTEAEKKIVSKLLDGTSMTYNLAEIRQLCHDNNWGTKFCKKYRISMQEMPKEIETLIQKTGTVFTPLQHLIKEVGGFADALLLHHVLEQAAFTMLEQKKDIVLALQILFYSGQSEKSPEDDGGTLSVVLDSKELMSTKLSVATASFTNLLNSKLLEADAAAQTGATPQEADAFGRLFHPLEEPMPTVKLAAGFEVSLRTMFRGQPCQSRYGRIENATYPISKEMRLKLQSALAWVGCMENKEVTWCAIDKNEALFAYPETLRENQYSMLNYLGRKRSEEDRADKEDREKKGNQKKFEDAAKAFISELQKTKKPGSDPMSERIQYFVVRKLDKARTKVVYTYNTTPAEIENRSEQWSLGCQNLPAFSFGQPETLFPLEVSTVLNIVWRQDGRPATDKFKVVPHYHGMRLLFGLESAMIRRDLFDLMNRVANLAPYLGMTEWIRKGYSASQGVPVDQTKMTLGLMGLLLYQLDIRKEKYMQEFSYLFGQLLKVSDELHEMYCKVVRKNEMPNTLAGSGLYAAGAEQPYKTLGILGQRMNPYITWAKSYRTKGIEEGGKESRRAGECLVQYGEIATRLYAAWGNQTRFSEEEKAQYFIGYLAALPKSEEAEKQSSGSIGPTEDAGNDSVAVKNDNGGNENG